MMWCLTMMTMNKVQKYSSSILGELLNEVSPKVSEKTRKRMLLAGRIEDAIKEKGWAKVDFARVMGRWHSLVTKWLSGTYNFNIELLFDIGSVLGVKLIVVEGES